MDENEVKVIEGVLTEDSTPLAFRLASEMKDAIVAFNAKPDEEKDLRTIVNFLIDQQTATVITLGRLELAVNMHAGDAFTGRDALGTMTVDRKPAV